MIRNGETGDWIGTFVGHKGAVWSADINSSALQVVTASADYSAKLWDALTGDEIRTLPHSRIVKTARFSKDDKKVVTGGQDKIIRVWDLEKADADPTKLEGHTETIRTAVWAGKNNGFILSAGADNGIRFWDVRSGQQVRTYATRVPVTSLEVCLDGRHVICTHGKTVAFLDGETFEEIKTVQVSCDVNSASLSPDGSLFVAGCVDFSARVFDFKEHNELELLKGHHGPVHCIRFAPDGATFASGSEDGTLRLWQSGHPRCYGLWQQGGGESEPSTAS